MMKIAKWFFLTFPWIPFFSCATDESYIGVGSYCYNAKEATGSVIKQSRNLPFFERVLNQSSVDIIIVSGQSSQEVTVEAQESLLSQIRTEVQGNQLIISMKGSYCTRQNLAITLHVPKLLEIVNKSSGDIQGQNLNSPQLCVDSLSSGDINLSGQITSLHLLSSGSGDINLKQLSVQDMNLQKLSSAKVSLCITRNAIITSKGSGDIHISCAPQNITLQKEDSGNIHIQSLQGNTVQITKSGSGDIVLSGRVQNLKIIGRGNGDVEANDLQAQFVELDVSGSGDIKVCPLKEVKGSRSGSGNLDLYCEPKVNNISKTGSGDIRNRF